MGLRFRTNGKSGDLLEAQMAVNLKKRLLSLLKEAPGSIRRDVEAVLQWEFMLQCLD
jgi:hypothetical protein